MRRALALLLLAAPALALAGCSNKPPADAEGVSPGDVLVRIQAGHSECRSTGPNGELSFKVAVLNRGKDQAEVSVTMSARFADGGRADAGGDPQPIPGRSEVELAIDEVPMLGRELVSCHAWLDDGTEVELPVEHDDEQPDQDGA